MLLTKIRLTAGFRKYYDEVKPEGETGTESEKGSKTYTEEEAKTLLETERKKWEQQKQDLATQLTELSKSKDLTQAQKDELTQTIADLKLEKESTVKLAEREKQKLLDEKMKVEKTLTEERNLWKQRYETALVDRELQDAAVKAGAYNPNQVVQLLKPSAKVIENDGTFKVVVQQKGADGKELQLPVTDTLTLMVEDTANYGNLFKSTMKSGTGSYPTGEGGPKDLIAAATSGDLDRYRELRQKRK